MRDFATYNKQLLVERRFNRDCESTCRDFITFCKSHLDLNDHVTVQFLTEHDPNITTGCYNTQNKKISILVKNRGLVDVLRSIAHEMVHQKQHVDGVLHADSGANGSDHENEAHAKAGLIMRLYQADNKDKIY